jgi:hypothetical protein
MRLGWRRGHSNSRSDKYTEDDGQAAGTGILQTQKHRDRLRLVETDDGRRSGRFYRRPILIQLLLDRLAFIPAIKPPELLVRTCNGC